MAKKSNNYLEDFTVAKKPIRPEFNQWTYPVVIETEEDRGYDQCCEPFLVLADSSDSDRYKNDVNSAWSHGDTVIFTLKNKETGATTTYTPTSVAFPNESDAYYCTIEWRDVLASDGIGCYELYYTPTVGGVPKAQYLWGTYQLLEYQVDHVYMGQGTVRILSEFNDVNNQIGINFTDARVLDSVRFKGKFGYFNPNTVVDNTEYLDGTMEKVKREDFDDYELRVSLNGYSIIQKIRFHLLAENTCWISDHNFDNFSYFYMDVPVILKEGLQPEHIDGTRRIKGVIKFEDKVKTSSTHFQDNRQTAEADPAPDVCLPVTVTDGATTTDVPAGGTYTCAGGGGLATESAKLIKTGQTTSYRTGDDGDLENGRATDFNTLPGNNPFGTNARFTDELGGQTYTSGIVLDWSTYDGSAVLGYGVLQSANSWNSAIDNSIAYSLGGFASGWRLANLNELQNIANRSLGTVTNYTPFNNASATPIWSSTTWVTNATYAFSLNNNAGDVRVYPKTNNRQYYPVRDFTNAELGI